MRTKARYKLQGLSLALYQNHGIILYLNPEKRRLLVVEAETLSLAATIDMKEHDDLLAIYDFEADEWVDEEADAVTHELYLQLSIGAYLQEQRA